MVRVLNLVTGINQLSQTNSIKVYPNPSNGLFTFESSGVSFNAKIEIYNVLGEKVDNASLQRAQGDYQIDLRSQPPGIYLYRIVSEQGKLLSTGKLIIQ